MQVIGGAAVSLGLNNSGFMAGLAMSSNALRKFGTDTNVLKSASLGFVAVGAGVLAAGVAAVKMAGNFQEGVTTLVTGAGEAQKNIGLISNGILDLSTKTGETTKQLTDGMFMIESAGYRGADGLNVLADAAEGARVGNAELGTEADAVTTILKDYNIKAKNAGDAVNFLTGVVQNGKTTLQQLAGSMSAVLPTAAALGVHLIDVGGAMATMTGEGVPAANAATYLRQMLIALEAPAKAGAKALSAIGLTTQQVSDEMKQSLPDALQMIMSHLADTYTVGSPQYVKALKDIAGGSKQMQGILDLTGTHLRDFQTNVQSVANTMQQGKGQVVGWSEVQKDLNLQLDKARAAFDAVMIKVGMQLMPIVSNFLNKDVVPAIQQFSDWATHTTALHDAFQTVITVIETVISDTETLINWVSKGGPQVDALKTAVLLLGGAFVALKLANTVASFGQMFSTVTAGKGIIEGFASSIINKFAPDLAKALDGTAGKAKAACENVGCIGGNAKTAAADVTSSAVIEEDALGAVDAKVKGVNADLIATGPAAAEGGAAAKVGLAGLLESLGTIAGFATLLAIPFFTASPSTKAALVPEKKDQYPAPPGFWDLITHQGLSKNQTQDFSQMLIQPAKDSKTIVDNIDKAWNDMEALYGAAENRGQILGDLTDPRVMDKADVQIQQLKSHLDDLGKPVIIKPLTPDVVAARLKIIDLKSHIDDLKGPTNIGVLSPDVVASRLKVIDLKSHIDDLKGPTTIGVTTPHVTAATVKVIELKSHLDDVGRANPSPSIGTGSIDAARYKVAQLIYALDNMPSPNIGGAIPAAGPASGYHVRGFATGILNNPLGQVAMVGEHGPELMYVPKGASIFPNDQLSSGGSGQGSLPGGKLSGQIILEINGRRFAQATIDDIGDALAKNLRVRTGMRM